MKALNRFSRRVFNFITGRRYDDRLKEEMESHLAALIEENLHSGMTAEEATRQARLKFGAVGAVREDYHAESRLPFVEDLLLDTRYALRVLRKSPAFTLVALLTLTLAIGANVIAFGIVNAVLLHPLDVQDPQNLYQLRLQPRTSFKLLTTSYPAFEDYRQRNHTFSGLAGYYGWCHARLSWDHQVKSVFGYAVTGNYFELLGVQPEIGRFIQSADERGPGSAPYVVLSHELWARSFNADPAILGASVRLDKDLFTVIGVAPALFHGTEQFVWPDYFIPLVNYFGSDYLQSRTGRPLVVLGRLKPGVTAAQATENLSEIASQLGKEYPQTDTGVPLRLVRPGLYADNADSIRRFLYAVNGLALLVLVAACANLASLFTARAADRSRELALRMALGASRSRLVRQLMTEATLLSLLGGAAGLGMAALLLNMLNRWPWPSFLGNSPATHLAVSVDARVYLAGLGFSVISALLFGMIPAWQAWRSSPLQAMKGGPMGIRFPHGFNLPDFLLGAQISICTLMITASLVAVLGMLRLLQAPLGFQPHGVILANMDLSLVEPEGDIPIERKKAMIEAVRNIPGITAVGVVDRVPFTGGLRGVPIFLPGTTALTLNHAALFPYVFIMSPGYLEAAGTRLLSGRDFSWHDRTGTPAVAVVNQTFARQMWESTPAIGQRFLLQDHLTEAVGVVEDGKYDNLQESPQPVAFLPLSQNEDIAPIFVARGQGSQRELSAAIESTLKRLEPNAQLTVRSWPDQLGGFLFSARAAAALLGIVGLLAAMLAVTGIFGMAAYNVSRRMKELGIRIALGARPLNVIGAAVGRPIVLLGIGSLAGLLLGALANRLLAPIVYQADPRDPLIMGCTVLMMALLGVVASVLPALRALAINPSHLLRQE